MNLILTNDDGIEALGLSALERAASGFGRAEVFAPSQPWSNKGHTVTTREPIRFRRLEAGRTSIEGSPADCVRVGLALVSVDVEWVLSGINAGANLGADVYHSGTAAAAREAALHGKKAIAVSHYIARDRIVDWEQASRDTVRVLQALFEKGCPAGTFWNVNLPHPEAGAPTPQIVFCALDPSPLPVRFRIEGDQAHYVGDYHARARLPNRDVAVCLRGDISVSLLELAPRESAEESFQNA